MGRLNGTNLRPDPGFVDAAGGNLRLHTDSPAVDYCDDSAYTAFWDDTDMQPRGVDLPGNPNGSPGVSGCNYLRAEPSAPVSCSRNSPLMAPQIFRLT